MIKGSVCKAIAVLTFTAIPFLHAEEDGPCTAGGAWAYADCMVPRWEAAETAMQAAFEEALVRAQQEDVWMATNQRELRYERMLLKSQEAWSTYRDVDCELAGVSAGGSWVGVHIRECQMNEDLRRANTLIGFLGG